MKLLKIGASWCGPCQTMNKKLESFKLCEVVHYDVDTDEGEEMSEKYKVRNIPVMVLVDDDGNELKRWNGLTNIADIENEVKLHQ